MERDTTPNGPPRRDDPAKDAGRSQIDIAHKASALKTEAENKTPHFEEQERVEEQERMSRDGRESEPIDDRAPSGA